MVAVHISKHSLFRLKIGCRLSIVWCGVCGVLWWCVVVVCVLLCCGGGVCGVWWSLAHSLSCSLSFLFSFPFFFSLIFLFLSSFFYFSLAPSLTLALALVLSLSLLSSFFPSHSSLLFPSRQQTMYKALINKYGVQLWGVWMWCGARYVHSNCQRIARNVPIRHLSSSLLLSPPSSLPPTPRKIGDSLLQEYFRRGNYFVLQFYINSEKSTPGEITVITVWN